VTVLCPDTPADWANLAGELGYNPATLLGLTWRGRFFLRRFLGLDAERAQASYELAWRWHQVSAPEYRLEWCGYEEDGRGWRGERSYSVVSRPEGSSA